MQGIAASAGMAAPLTHWRFIVDDVIRMGEAGILTEDDRVELIEGELLIMSPIGARHVWIVTLVTDVLTAALGRSVFVSVQNPVRLSDTSAPQPDVVVLRRREEDYGDRFPDPADVLLVIEVADSSLDYDRTVKLPLYARAGLTEVWIANLPDNSIERYYAHGAGSYAVRQVLAPGEMLVAHGLPLSLAVADILGVTQAGI